MERPVYPFTAIVGQDQMRLGLVLAVISRNRVRPGIEGP